MIFLPGLKADEAQQSLGFFGIFDHFLCCSAIETEGPEGLHGSLCFWKPSIDDDRFDYRFQPNRQTWIRALADGEHSAANPYFVGIENDAPPTPDELEGPYPRMGTFVRLGDGNEWRIPTPHPHHLPRDLRRGGRDQRFIEHQQIYDYLNAVRAWQKLLADVGELEQLNFDDVERFLQRAIRLNYRITSEVINHLQLINSENAVSALLTACGVSS